MDEQLLDAVLREVFNLAARRIDAHGLEAVANERHLHHMFSHLLALQLQQRSIRPWEDRVIRPEEPTNKPFNFSAYRRTEAYRDPILAKDKLLNGGKCGNLDFAIVPSGDEQRRFLVEWKGPLLFQDGELCEVFLKLLSERSQDVKVFAAFLRRPPIHKPDWETAYVLNRVNRALRFAAEALDLADLRDMNLHIFVSARVNGAVQEIIHAHRVVI